MLRCCSLAKLVDGFNNLAMLSERPEPSVMFTSILGVKSPGVLAVMALDAQTFGKSPLSW